MGEFLRPMPKSVRLGLVGLAVAQFLSLAACQFMPRSSSERSLSFYGDLKDAKVTPVGKYFSALSPQEFASDVIHLSRIVIMYQLDENKTAQEVTFSGRSPQSQTIGVSHGEVDSTKELPSWPLAVCSPSAKGPVVVTTFEDHRTPIRFGEPVKGYFSERGFMGCRYGTLGTVLDESDQQGVVTYIWGELQRSEVYSTNPRDFYPKGHPLYVHSPFEG